MKKTCVNTQKYYEYPWNEKDRPFPLHPSIGKEALLEKILRKYAKILRVTLAFE